MEIGTNNIGPLVPGQMTRMALTRISLSEHVLILNGLNRQLCAVLAKCNNGHSRNKKGLACRLLKLNKLADPCVSIITAEQRRGSLKQYVAVDHEFGVAMRVTINIIPLGRINAAHIFWSFWCWLA